MHPLLLSFTFLIGFVFDAEFWNRAVFSTGAVVLVGESSSVSNCKRGFASRNGDRSSRAANSIGGRGRIRQEGEITGVW